MYNVIECESVNSMSKVCGDKPLIVELRVENSKMLFEIDTGSPITAISKEAYKSSLILSRINLRETNRRLKGYGGNVVVPLGIIDVKVKYKNIARIMELFIMPGVNAAIVGRPWL